MVWSQLSTPPSVGRAATRGAQLLADRMELVPCALLLKVALRSPKRHCHPNARRHAAKRVPNIARWDALRAHGACQALQGGVTVAGFFNVSSLAALASRKSFQCWPACGSNRAVQIGLSLACA